MSDKELMQKNIEEFARLQDYMIDTEKESAAYRKMKRRYIELKVILTSSKMLNFQGKFSIVYTMKME